MRSGRLLSVLGVESKKSCLGRTAPPSLCPAPPRLASSRSALTRLAPLGVASPRSWGFRSVCRSNFERNLPGTHLCRGAIVLSLSRHKLFLSQYFDGPKQHDQLVTGGQLAVYQRRFGRLYLAAVGMLSFLNTIFVQYIFKYSKCSKINN